MLEVFFKLVDSNFFFSATLVEERVYKINFIAETKSMQITNNYYFNPQIKPSKVSFKATNSDNNASEETKRNFVVNRGYHYIPQINLSNVSFKANSSDDKGLEEAKINFEKFVKNGQKTLEEINSQIQDYYKQIDISVEQSPEYIEQKAKYLKKAAAEIKLASEKETDLLSTIPDLTSRMRQEKLKELIKPVEENALDPNKDDFAAKLILYSIGFHPKVENLKGLDKKLEELKTKKDLYIYVSPLTTTINWANSKSEFELFNSPLMDDTGKKLLKYFKELAEKGDLAAKAILWSKDKDNRSLNRCNLNRISDKIITTIEFNLRWGLNTLTVDGKDIGINETNFESIKPDLEKHIQIIKQEFNKLASSCNIQNRLTDEVKKEALQYADKIINQMDEFEASPEMQKAKKEYDKALQEETAKLKAEMALPLEVQAENKFDKYEKSDLKTVLNEKKRIDYYKKIVPIQLDNWSEGVSTNLFHPKRLVLLNPLRVGSVTRGFGGTVSTNAFGDLILEFPEGNKGYFKNIEYLKKDNEEEYFKVTEAKPDGSEETYTLVTGSKTQDGDYCAKIICESGNQTILEYGEPVVFASVVRKPVIAFRDFSTDTEITLSVDFSGNYKTIYPKETTRNDQTISWTGKVFAGNKFKIENKNYPYLFWDGLLSPDLNFHFNEGYCIADKNVIEFFEDKCASFGLDSSLTADFITFWAPYLQENKYSLIRFLTEEECNQLAHLTIEPNNTEPIQVVRFYMIFKAVDEMVNLPEPNLPVSKLNDNPKIFDWGGFQII